VPPAPVCAIIYGRAPDPAPGVLHDAVVGQTAPPAEIFAPPQTGERGDLAWALQAAAPPRQPWLWLLDGWAQPAPDALHALLSAASRTGDPSPVLVSSTVLDAAGELHPDGLPRHEIFEKERSVAAAENRLVQLRIAGPGSVLVSADAVARVGPPRVDLPEDLVMREWSARMLRSWDDVGYLVADSVAVRRAPARRATVSEWIGRIRMIGSRAWTPTERLWETFLLGEQALAALRGGHGVPQDGDPDDPPPSLRDSGASVPPAYTHRAGRAG
jgi:hypothetical protein